MTDRVTCCRCCFDDLLQIFGALIPPHFAEDKLRNNRRLISVCRIRKFISFMRSSSANVKADEFRSIDDALLRRLEDLPACIGERHWDEINQRVDFVPEFLADSVINSNVHSLKI